MKWIELLRNGDYALLQSESDTQYAVVSGYDPTQPEGQQWAHGTHFTYFQNNPKKILYLQSAYDCFMEKVNADFIPRCRLEELATLFKNGLISDDRDSALEYFDECCEMSDEEKSFFGIEEDSPIANTKFENPMYNKGYDDGFSDGANSIEEEQTNMGKIQEYEYTPTQMAEKLLEFNRDFSDSAEDIQNEKEYIAELFEKLQNSNEFNILAHYLDTMFMDEVFNK